MTDGADNKILSTTYPFVGNNPINQYDPSGKQAVEEITEIAEEAQPTIQRLAQQCTTVYQSVVNGITKYVGITNNFVRRASEHAENGRVIEPILETTNRTDARAVEQVLIEQNGLNNLDNQINSISPNNPIYDQAIKTGSAILKTNGL